MNDAPCRAPRLDGYADMVLPYAAQACQAMMRPGELKLIHTLCRDWAAPDLDVVDAGVFLGASTVAMATGLDARSDKDRFLKRLHAYDLFLNSSPFYARLLGGCVADRESFLPLFLHNIRGYDRYVNVYPGDLLRYRWIGKRIGLFLCDVAKSPALNAFVFTEFAPHWIPGETVFIQQDFVHIQAPWVQLSIAALMDHFDFLTVETPSLALQLRTAIPDWKIARVASDDYSDAERIELIEALKARFEEPETVATLELIAIALVRQSGDLPGARARAERAAADYAEIGDRYFEVRLEKTLAACGVPLPG